MKIKNPAIVAAIEKVAHVLNVSADEVLDYLLEYTAERIESNPIDVLTDIAHFVYDTEAEAQTAAERLEEVATSEALEGRSQFTISCQVVEAGDGFRLRVNQLHPKTGWCPVTDQPYPEPAAENEGEAEDPADWWKES